MSLYVGSEVYRLNGVNIIPASAGRKQIMYAISDVTVTMSFATSAKTIVEAEDEFTDEAHLLGSRSVGANNKITITKE